MTSSSIQFCPASSQSVWVGSGRQLPLLVLRLFGAEPVCSRDAIEHGPNEHNPDFRGTNPQRMLVGCERRFIQIQPMYIAQRHCSECRYAPAGRTQRNKRSKSHEIPRVYYGAEKKENAEHQIAFPEAAIGIPTPPEEER